MRGESSGEIFRKSQQIAEGSALLDLIEEVPRQLPDLDPLEAQLPRGIAAGDLGAEDGGEQSLFFGAGPTDEVPMKVVQRQPIGLFVAAIERLLEVLEARPERPRGRE